ncbi:hypothetical protein MK489_06005 [Myxococcota bacterium]|nr:hypothetical protein [Myxococcota bacterium]
MSVHGEFRRSAQNYIDFLRPVDDPQVDALLGELRTAEVDRESNLSDLASRVLDLLDGEPGRIALERIRAQPAGVLDISQHDELHDHLRAICRVITGR